MIAGTPGTGDPHVGQPVLAAGAALSGARAALVMIHGRGDSARGILGLAPMLEMEGVALLAPQAAGNSWYPYGFMEPLARNEPWIPSGIRALGTLIERIAAAGIPAERTLLFGFSQGACLAAEYAARHPRRYGGIACLSGGLIGPDGTPRDYEGSLAGTPVFFGCSDADSHIPATRVSESAEVLERLGGAVTLRFYPGMGHTINDDEIAAVRAMLMTGM